MPQNTKPVVHYTPHPNDHIVVDESATVMCPIDHPSPRVRNGYPCYTTKVLMHNPETGEFETRNTIYIPQ